MSENDSSVIAPKKTEPKRKREYKVTFRENRSFELYVGRIVIPFDPHETKVLDESIVAHGDFRQMAHVFAVREVTK